MALYLGTKLISSVDVGVVPASSLLQEKSVSPSEEIQNILPDTGYIGLTKVVVSAVSSNYVGSSIPREEAKTVVPSTTSQTAISEGTYVIGNITVAGDADLLAENIKNGVNIFGVVGTYGGGGCVTQEKTINPSESQQIVEPDNDYDGLSKVTVNAIPGNYIGSQITQHSDSGNVTLNSSVLSKSYPAGYYANSHGAMHSTVTIPNPNITINSSGLLTASANWTAGFTVNTSYSSTQQLTTKSATVVIPSKVSQVIAESGVYTTGTLTVGAIPSEYITTTDATATSSDILNNKTAYVNGAKITGSLIAQKYYEGSSIPSSSLGNNGDLYLMTGG